MPLSANVLFLDCGVYAHRPNVPAFRLETVRRSKTICVTYLESWSGHLDVTPYGSETQSAALPRELLWEKSNAMPHFGMN